MLAAGLWSLLVLAAAAPPRPNIVWIMSDDLGWGEPGLFPATSEHGRIATPHLDAFGESGLRFTNAYAGYTVCAPSRTTLMTGYHSGSFLKKGFPGSTLAANQTTTTTWQMLQKAGYKTAGVGKMAPLHDPVPQGFDYFIGQVDQALCHNMYPRTIDTGLRPTTPQPNCTTTGFCNVPLPQNDKIPTATRYNHTAAREACMASPSDYNYTVDITAHHSLAFIRDQVSSSSGSGASSATSQQQPFFLYEAFTVPHAGGWGYSHGPHCAYWTCFQDNGAPVPSDGRYSIHTDWPEVERDHAAVITYLDGYVGDMMELLVDLGIDEQTLVFFASDNGAHLEGGHDYHYFNSTGGLLGHKRSLYEGGVRSPTMVRWPGTIKPGVSDFAWAFWDVMPTLAELVGGTVDPGIDGESIVPTLMGRTQPPKEYLFWTWNGNGCEDGSCDPLPPDALLQYPPAGWSVEQGYDGRAFLRNTATGEVSSTNTATAAKQSGYGMRVGEWKLVVPHCLSTAMVPSAEDQAAFEIYHLPSDPFEAHNFNETAQGRKQFESMLSIAIKHQVSCCAYQGQSGSKVCK